MVKTRFPIIYHAKAESSEICESGEFKSTIIKLQSTSAQQKTIYPRISVSKVIDPLPVRGDILKFYFQQDEKFLAARTPDEPVEVEFFEYVRRNDRVLAEITEVYWPLEAPSPSGSDDGCNIVFNKSMLCRRKLFIEREYDFYKGKKFLVWAVESNQPKGCSWRIHDLEETHVGR